MTNFKPQNVSVPCHNNQPDSIMVTRWDEEMSFEPESLEKSIGMLQKFTWIKNQNMISILPRES